MFRAADLARAILSVFVLSSCDLDVQPAERASPGLLRRIEQKAAGLTPGTNGPGWTELADLQLEAGQAFDAADSLKQAVEAGDNSARRFAAQAEAYLELGYTSNIASALRGCLEVSRTEGRCLYVLGRLMEGSNDPARLQEARLAYRMFMQVAPDSPKANYVKSALDQLDRVLGEAPDHPPASQPASPPASPPAVPGPNAPGASAPAPADAASSAVATPGHGTGNVDPNTGQEVGELNAFGQAIMKAIAAVKRNDPVAAEQAFTAALAIRPDDPSALAGRAESRFALGRTEEAVVDIERAYTVDPNDPQVRWGFGLIMTSARRRTAEAIAAWEALARDEPDYARQLKIPERLKAIKQFEGSGH